MLFGVSDESRVVGLSKELAKHGGSLEKFRDGLTSTIVNTVTPIPPYELLPPIKIDGKDVLAIKVSSDDQAHSLLFEKAHHFYIRRDATTRDANNFEIQELVRLKDMRKGMKPQSSILNPSSF
ncbi:MAG: helix-turn-helix domain-containing protein [Ktedonobacteraceae bacterium]